MILYVGCEDVDIWGGVTLATLQLQRVDASLSLERLQGAELRERLERVSEERYSAQEQCKKVRVEQKEEMKNKTAEATGAWMGAMLVVSLLSLLSISGVGLQHADRTFPGYCDSHVYGLSRDPQTASI